MLITTSVTSTVIYKPSYDNASSVEIQPEFMVCPGEPTYCACWMFQNPTYMYVQCNKHLRPDTDFSMFNKTIIPSKMLIQCDSRGKLPSTLSDGMFESLHAFISIEIRGCHLTHISSQAFKGMSSLKNILIQGGNDITMAKECLQIPELSNLETVTVIESGLTYAPVLCGREHLWLVNLTRNNLATFKDTGLICDHPTNVKVIDVSENAITDIPAGFSVVTEKLILFFASNNKIRDIAPTVFENLTSVVVIDLSGNMILKIPTDFLGLNSGMKTLKLSHNTVGLLPKGIFLGTLNITYIKFNGMALNDDVWFQFKHLTRLQFLNLRNNNIQSFDKKTLSEMKELLLLDLSDNNLPSISNRLFKSQSELKVLNLTGNRITFIEKDAFMGLHNLFKLDIQQNNIQSIHPDALIELGNLAQLNLSCNNIRILPKFPASLRLLDLGRNEISFIDNKVFSGLINVLGIGLAHNKITKVYQIAFQNNVKLQKLQLGHNSISSLDYTMFPLKSSLKAIFLDHNNISSIWAFPKQYFPQLRVLDISYNKIKRIAKVNFGQDAVFPESIEELHLAWNEIVLIENFAFQRPSLKYVDLRNNRIQFLSNLALITSKKGKMSVIYYLSGNPFFCDCNLQWLRDVITLQLNNSRTSIVIQDLNAVFCTYTWHSVPLLMKYMESSFFLCPYVETCISALCDCCKNVECYCRTKCPEGCNCARTKHWQITDMVSCSNANLTSLPSDISPTCTHLRLRGNNFSHVSSGYFVDLSSLLMLELNACQIRHIENGTFKSLSKLTDLDLSYNLLQSLTIKMFEGLDRLTGMSVSFNQIRTIQYGTFKSLKSLRFLDLSSNQLQMFSVYDFKFLSTLYSLKLSKNPWSCDCDYLEHMKNFTIANAGQIKDIHKVSCLFYNVTSNETLKYPMAGVHMPDFCVNQTTFYNEGTTNLDTPTVVAMSTVLSLFVLGMIIFGVIFWNREFLKVWCFVKFGWKWHRKETEEDALRPYDAFVSYSSDDEHFVIRELVPYLEENQRRRPGYRLCVHYRDFAVGASIAESIILAVKHSKRVIIILSENFLHSEWCQFEFQKAYHQLLEEKRNRIIMILLHDIDNQMLDNQLGDYLKTRTYVKYGDPWLWAKVEYALPNKTPPARQHEGVIPYDPIQHQVSIDEGDVINEDTELILDDRRNHEVDAHEQNVFEMEIEQ